MTTRYKAERIKGIPKRQAVATALSASIPSIIVSGMGLFAATFGVALYSDIDMISSLCMLMARGAVVSMFCVIFILPALLVLCDKLIRVTTLGMKIKGDPGPGSGASYPKIPKWRYLQNEEIHCEAPVDRSLRGAACRLRRRNDCLRADHR